MMVDWHIRKRPSVLGMLSGAVSGLVAITPACGYVQTSGALAIGVLSGIGCYFGTKLKHRLGYGKKRQRVLAYDSRFCLPLL